MVRTSAAGFQTVNAQFKPDLMRLIAAPRSNEVPNEAAARLARITSRPKFSHTGTTFA
jgi:hypothetical protein